MHLHSLRVQFLLPRIAATVLAIVVITSCNLPGVKKSSNYASRSQALSGTSGGERLDYDHNFSYVYGGFLMEVTVKGSIPLTLTEAGVGPTLKCIIGETLYFQMSGSATIPVEASMEVTDSSGDSCSFSWSDSIEVNILGKTFYEWLTPGDKCPQPRIALQVKEKWYTSHNVQCTCDDEDDCTEHFQMSVASIPAMGNPDLEKKTMVFPYMCPAVSSLIETWSDPTGMGSGSYKWTYSSGINEGPDRLKCSLNYEDCFEIKCISGEWGPSLDGIEQNVREWFEH